jgi:hypothetical protein
MENWKGGGLELEFDFIKVELCFLVIIAHQLQIKKIILVREFIQDMSDIALPCMPWAIAGWMSQLNLISMLVLMSTSNDMESGLDYNGLILIMEG